MKINGQHIKRFLGAVLVVGNLCFYFSVNAAAERGEAGDSEIISPADEKKIQGQLVNVMAEMIAMRSLFTSSIIAVLVAVHKDCFSVEEDPFLSGRSDPNGIYSRMTEEMRMRTKHKAFDICLQLASGGISLHQLRTFLPPVSFVWFYLHNKIQQVVNPDGFARDVSSPSYHELLLEKLREALSLPE